MDEEPLRGRQKPSPRLSWRAAADEDVGSSECKEQGGKSPRSLHPVHILDFLCSCPLKHTHTQFGVCRLGSSLTVPGKRRSSSSSSSREGQRVITYSLEFESLRRQLEIQRPAKMVSSPLERDGPGVRLMSAHGSERCPHAGVMSRSSSHWRNSLGLFSRSQLEVGLSTASSDKDAGAVMSQMVSRVSPGDDGAHA